MPISSFIANRYFTGRKKMFGSFLTVISVLGVAVGAFTLILVMSVMSGFSHDLQKKLIGFNAHIVIEEGDSPLSAGGLSPFISASIIEGEGIIESFGGVKIRGMDETDFSKLRGVEWNFLNPLQPPPSKGGRGGIAVALVGNELALQLGVNPGYSDRITLISPLGRVGPTGELMPEKMEFAVAGTFHSGYFEHDSKTVIISRENAARLLGDNAKESLNIWLDDVAQAEKVAEKLRAEFPEKNIYTWAEANKKLYSALKLEKFAMLILLSLIIAVACISIISVIFIYVFSRRKDIALLSSLGASKRQIAGIFIRIGACIGAIGTFLGLAGGITACFYLQNKMIKLPASYYLENLPVSISWPFIFAVAVFGILFAILASLYPANIAADSNPAEMLRDE